MNGAQSGVVTRLEAGQCLPLQEPEPTTLTGGPADLYMTLPTSRREHFVTTLPNGVALPACPKSAGLSIKARRRSMLVRGGSAHGALLWLEALRRAARTDAATAGGSDKPDDHAASTEALLDAIATRLEDDAQTETSADVERRQRDKAFGDTLAGFGRLLQGRFHREPASARSPLAAASARLVEMLHLKVLTVRERDGETREDFLERFTAVHGLRLRHLRLDPADMADGEGPLLVFDTAGRPLIVKPRAWGGFTVEHPDGIEPPRRLHSEEWRAFSADAFSFCRTLPDGKLSYWTIARFGLLASAWDFVLLAACGMIGAVLALLPPIASAEVASIAAHTADVAFLAELLAVLGVCLVAETIFFVVGKLAELRAQGRSGFTLHAAMVDRLLRLPSQTRRSSTTLILATQMETVEKFRRAAIGFATSGIVALANAVAAAVLVAVVSASAGFAAIGLVLIFLCFTAFLGWAQFKAIYDGERMDVIVLAFVYDLVRLIPVTRAARMEKRAFTQWSENFLSFQSRLMRSARISNWLPVIEPAWDALALALCFAALAYMGAVARMGAAEAVVFVLALGRLTHSGKDLAHALMGFSKLMPMAKLARPLIEYQVEPFTANAPAPKLTGRVEMAGVSFFHGARRVLTDIDLSIAEGEFIGLAGPSGSGKSTLVSLLAGLERPQSGRVLLDGHDLVGLDRRQISRQIGLVTHGSRLFPGTIFENIRGISAIGSDDAWEVAEQAGIADELRGLPMGLSTIITESGSGLAMGQMQRILIARALAQRPAILILDEAMSMLDGASQQRILATLHRLRLTRILVTHQPSVLKDVDRVVVLDRGAVADIGRPGEIAFRQRFVAAQGRRS